MVDALWSGVLYSGALMVGLGLASLIKPVRVLRIRSRRHAAIVLLSGPIFAAVPCSTLPRAATLATQGSGLDEFAPTFHFREHHETLVDASAEDVFAAVKATTASDIALFQSFAWIRRLGRTGAENILNAPDHDPILAVATRTTFLKLFEQSRHEVVIGTVVVAPDGFRRSDVSTPDHYKGVVHPGFALATMNFMVAAHTATSSLLTTETRVFATDGAALKRFTPYWRVIYPGSAILRVTWLRAIKQRAEATARSRTAGTYRGQRQRTG